MIARAAIGLVLAALIVVAARRSGSLGTGGSVSALALGTISMAAGWSWGALLISFFVTASLLSRLGAEAKRLRTAGIVAKGHKRDAAQVLANGGMFGVAALLWMVEPWPGWLAIGAGALAAVTADTWGTEVGTLLSAEPRMITTWEPVAAGTSGAVSVAGLLASVCGATFIAITARIADWPQEVAVAAILGGLAGALADSVLGASVQARRHCPVCDSVTERHVHRCGSLTQEAGGVKWLDNDVVNLLAAVCGGAVALIWWLSR